MENDTFLVHNTICRCSCWVIAGNKWSLNARLKETYSNFIQYTSSFARDNLNFSPYTHSTSNFLIHVFCLFVNFIFSSWIGGPSWSWSYAFTTKVTSLNPAYGEVYSIQHCVIKFVSYSETCLNQTLSKPKTCLNQTDFTVPSTKCLCNMNLYKANTCLNWTNSSVPKRFGLDRFYCTCSRWVVFSGYSSFLHKWNWLPRCNRNIVESGVKHHNHNPHHEYSYININQPIRYIWSELVHE